MAASVTIAVDRDRLKTIANQLRRNYSAVRVILFGSAARGDATEHSDIDLLVVAETSERFYERMGSALAVVRDISRGLPLAPIVVTPGELSARLARGDQFMQEIVEAGVEL